MLALFKRFVGWLKPDVRELKDDLTIPLPPGPSGFSAWVFYRYVPDPEMGMLCWEMYDGTLIPLHCRTPWTPDHNWKFEKRTYRDIQSANVGNSQPVENPEKRAKNKGTR